MVRAKFNCVSKTETRDGHTVILEPVTSGSEENKNFFKYTPFGKFELGTINAEVAKQLEVGKAYYIDFTESEEN